MTGLACHAFTPLARTRAAIPSRHRPPNTAPSANIVAGYRASTLRLEYFESAPGRFALAFQAYGGNLARYPLARDLPHHAAAHLAACLRRLDNPARWRLLERIEAGERITIR